MGEKYLKMGEKKALADEYEKKTSDANYPEKSRNQQQKSAHTFNKTQRPNTYQRYNINFSMEELMWSLGRRGGSSTWADNISYPMQLHGQGI